MNPTITFMTNPRGRDTEPVVEMQRGEKVSQGNLLSACGREVSGYLLPHIIQICFVLFDATVLFQAKGPLPGFGTVG